MFEIDYLKLLTEQKIYNAFFELIKKNTTMSDIDINNYLENRINHHGKKMNNIMSEHIDFYQKAKDKGSTNKEIDRKLDEMVNNIKTQSKNFNKE